MMISAASRSIQQTPKTSLLVSNHLRKIATESTEAVPAVSTGSSGKAGPDISKISTWAPTLIGIGVAVLGYGYKRLEDRDNVIEGKIDKVNDRIDKVNDRIDKVNENMLDMRKEHNAQMLELSTQVAQISGKLDVLIDSSRTSSGKKT